MVRLRLLGSLDLTASEGRDLRPLLAQPKRVAVLAYLAARPAAEFVRRDTLLGLFWPDQEQAAGRRSLRQALHLLRTHLGPDLLLARGDEELAINPDRLAADVPEFLAGVAGRRAEALELYRGELLAGFFLNGGSVAFERWLEETRASLREAAARLASVLAREAEGAGDLERAVAWARRASALEPDSEAALRRLLDTLERAGDRAGALHAYDAFARNLRRDLDQEPSPETREHAARLRLAAAVDPPAGAAPAALRPAPSRRRIRLRWLAGAGAAAAAVTLFASVAIPRRAPARLLAVGEVRSGDAQTPELALRALPELLATDLARIGGVGVISHPRLEAVAGQLEAAGRPANAAAAARAAGAADLIEGVLYRRSPRTLRLDLRRVDAATGVTRDAVTVEGGDAFALADSAVAHFAARFGRARPTPGLSAVTSPSLLAHDLYDQGLRTYYRDGDYRAAARLFTDALDQDSTFAMAAYYLGRSQEALDPAAGAAAYARAARLAAHATERERLLIDVQAPAARNEPRWIALAESLGVRYPDEPEGRYAEGMARQMTGDFAGAAASFRAVIGLDSLSLGLPGARCVACDAYESLVLVEIERDSMAAALREAARWLHAQPEAPRAWERWGDALERQERLEEALAARDTAARLRNGTGATASDTAYYLIRGGRFAAAERILSRAAGRGSADQRGEATWWRVVALRYAGRPRQAAEVARALDGPADREGPAPAMAGMALGQTLFEAGDLTGAAGIFDSAGFHTAAFRHANPGLAARHRAWGLAQRASVAAAQGDLGTLRALADSVTRYARLSAFGRDRRLPAYVHGLILERSGRLAEAVDSFRAAVYSPTEGYTRVNAELARTLLALGRPREAIPWLEAVLRGGIEASNYYFTQTDAHDLLARAFARAGERDSALVHYAWVRRAWATAEPEFAARRAAADRYLAETPGGAGVTTGAVPSR